MRLPEELLELQRELVEDEVFIYAYVDEDDTDADIDALLLAIRERGSIAGSRLG